MGEIKLNQAAPDQQAGNKLTGTDGQRAADAFVSRLAGSQRPHAVISNNAPTVQLADALNQQPGRRQDEQRGGGTNRRLVDFGG